MIIVRWNGEDTLFMYFPRKDSEGTNCFLPCGSHRHAWYISVPQKG